MRIITIVCIILFGIFGLTTTLVPAEKSAEVLHKEQPGSSDIQKKVISIPVRKKLSIYALLYQHTIFSLRLGRI